ncbi:MAG: methyltransferase domain-containing protein [Thermomicrobiales bacterium]|nr:methyltransferase domain-containing protein [Thermomicrobiales bacterium]
MVDDIDLAAHAEASSNYRKHTSGNPLQRRLIERFHRRIARQVEGLGPKSFLDAGCGEGFVAAALLDRMPHLQLTGIDASADATRIAQERLPQGRFMTGDVLALPFPDRSFDVVGCFEVLEHLPGDGPSRALREYARLARVGVVLSVPHEPFFSLANAVRGKNLDVRPYGSDPDHKQFWSRESFGRLVGEQFDVVWLGGSFPWIICAGRARH